MENMKDTEADLGLAVSITNKWKNSNTDAGAGAGANANSVVDMMTFVGSDRLAELVWSPQTGLNIKFADKKPCFIGPSDKGVLQSKDTQDGKHISRGHSGPQNQRAAEPLSGHLCEHGITRGVDGSDSDIGSPLKVEATTQCGLQKQVEKGNVIIEKDGCFNDPFPKNAILENEKSFEKHEVESHGSMESCRSAKRKRRWSFEQQLILGSKRIKKQSHELAVEKDGSFVNWISNMVKGLKNNRNHVQRINCLEIKEKEAKGVVKHISLYEKVTQEAPKGIFDAIRRLRLSRTDILKWTNARLSVSHLDGFFVRLRVAKGEEGAGGSRYYVACITGLQEENPWRDLKQPIPVKVGGVECFVESQFVSNCDFLEEELVAWWQKALKNGGTPFVKDLRSKLAERKSLGL